MSDHVPLEIQSKIIERLPVKSVVQRRTVCKSWKYLIDCPTFIKGFKSRKTHLFFRYVTIMDGDFKYVSIVDDDTFPLNKSYITVPDPIKTLEYIFTVSSVNEILCFYGSQKNYIYRKFAVFWNPTVEKTVSIPIFNPLCLPNGRTYIGFGVCPKTVETKIVRINTIGYPTVNWEVDIFMLSTRVWKNVSNIPSVFKSCDLTYCPVFVNGAIYWPACDNRKLPIGIRTNLVISYDLKSDEFGKVCLPDSLLHKSMNIFDAQFEVLKVYDSLGLFEYYYCDETRFCDVWIMQEGFKKSFSKIFTIKGINNWGRFRVLGLNKNCEAIIHNIEDPNSLLLKVYDPSSESISCVGINGCSYSFEAYSYTESLLLLDEANSIIH